MIPLPTLPDNPGLPNNIPNVAEMYAQVQNAVNEIDIKEKMPTLGQIGNFFRLSMNRVSASVGLPPLFPFPFPNPPDPPSPPSGMPAVPQIADRFPASSTLRMPT